MFKSKSKSGWAQQNQAGGKRVCGLQAKSQRIGAQ